MKINIFLTLVILLCFSYTQSHSWGTPNLNPVHGLFVKPSSDGTTGDLYVAASEDSGVKTQWIADQAINFIPVGAATQLNPTTVPVPHPPPPPPAPSHNDATSKRAVMPNPISSPPIQYAYAMPVPASAPGHAEGNPVAPYPYAYPVPIPYTPESSAAKCDSATNAGQYPFPYQYPFQLFYPHMMSAYTNAMSILKDVGLNEDTASSVMANAAPTWPPSPYAYPMYVMVDPTAWNLSPTSSASSTQATSSSSSSSESS